MGDFLLYEVQLVVGWTCVMLASAEPMIEAAVGLAAKRIEHIVAAFPTLDDWHE
jgi:hypothetical protein